MITMASPAIPSAMEAAGLNVNDLRQILKIEIEASNELQTKMDQFRRELLCGMRPSEKNISLMESANKDMTKDLVRRIERIEEQSDLTTTDREMLQALSARLAVCDQQAMRLVELRDLEREYRCGRQRLQVPPPPSHPPPPVLIRPKPVEVLPLGGRPRRPSTSPPAKVTEHLRAEGGRSTSPGPILDRVERKGASPSGSRERERRRDSLYLYRPNPQSSQPTSTVVTPPSPMLSRTPPTPRRHEDEPVEELPYRRPTMTAHRSSPKLIPQPFPEMQQRRHSPASTSPMFPTSAFNTPRSSSDGLTPPPVRSTSDLSLREHQDLPSARRASSYRPASYRDDDDDKGKSSWPMLYRILDVDPATDAAVFEQVARMALARLSLKHDPTRHPADPEAPIRWAAVVQAYDTLVEPDKRRAYDAHCKGAEETVSHFDFGRLSVR